MNRRTLLGTALAVALVPMGAFADGNAMVDYAPGVIETALSDGKTVVVDYSAKWCGTCKRQERVISALRDANPDYDTKMMFVRVDWDTYKDHDVTQTRNIPRRSTLLVLRGEDELGRLVAGTAEAEIQALLDLGL